MTKFIGPLLTQKKKTAFLYQYAKTGRAKTAAEHVKTSISTVYNWRKADVIFSTTMDKLKPVIAQMLIDEAVRRGMEGVDEPVFQGGKQVGLIRKYSDRLLTQLLKGFSPDQFGDKMALDLKHKGKGLEDFSNAELAAFLKEKD